VNLLEQRKEIRKLFRKQFLERFLCVDDKAEDFREYIALRKSNLLWIDSRAGYDGLEQILLVFAVHDGESARITECTAMPTQNPVSDGMECATPKPAGIDREQIRNASEHFARGFIRKRQQQNISWVDPVFEQVSDAIGKGAGLSRSCTCDHEKRTWRRRHSRELLFV